jgi:hypothetical protein
VDAAAWSPARVLSSAWIRLGSPGIPTGELTADGFRGSAPPGDATKSRHLPLGPVLTRHDPDSPAGCFRSAPPSRAGPATGTSARSNVGHGNLGIRQHRGSISHSRYEGLGCGYP